MLLCKTLFVDIANKMAIIEEHIIYFSEIVNWYNYYCKLFMKFPAFSHNSNRQTKTEDSI